MGRRVKSKFPCQSKFSCEPIRSNFATVKSDVDSQVCLVDGQTFHRVWSQWSYFDCCNCVIEGSTIQTISLKNFCDKVCEQRLQCYSGRFPRVKSLLRNFDCFNGRVHAQINQSDREWTIWARCTVYGFFCFENEGVCSYLCQIIRRNFYRCVGDNIGPRSWGCKCVGQNRAAQRTLSHCKWEIFNRVNL